MGFFKVPTLAVLLQVWTLLGAAAPTQHSNANPPSPTLIGPNIAPAYDSTLRNESSSTVLNASKYTLNVPLTARQLTRHSERFPDPYYYVLEDLTIEFYGYRGPNTIPHDDLHSLTNQASAICWAKMRARQGQSAVGTNPQSWSSGDITLWIGPSEQLIWEDLHNALVFIRHFVILNDFRGTQFFFLKDGLGHIGTGHILRLPEDKSVGTDVSATA